MTSTPARVFRPSRKTKGRRGFDPAGIFARLGLMSRSRDDLVAEIRQGLPVDVIDRLTEELGVSQQTLLKIISLPPATLARRRAQDRLTPQESDRVYRVATAYRAALQLFEGDAEAARRWLNEPAKALGGNTPLQHLDTGAGADAVQDLIGRLEHGVIT
jgi:putative toxin-antitoxin system antitoxin component (TIGR02293 family)